ncbi:MAG: ATP-binding protein [Endomicrobium sp.]|jgi:predicted AAA+ superfamily ATPase|nr:ATP-binding protein [Endomicrobium sp.]
MIKRFLGELISKKFTSGKAIIVMGPRQVGKTTLVESLLEDKKSETLFMSGDEEDIKALFQNASSTRFKSIFAGKKFIFIDEAQKIKDVGLKLKLIADNIKDIQLIATGSSSFDLANKINEPLTGRKWEYKMYPLSFGEMAAHQGLIDEKRLLKQRLIYGYYPDVVNNPGQEKDILKQLSDSYLYKDVLVFENIKKPEKLIKILQALALQIGGQVSFTEIGQMCSLDVKTVEKYIELLEKCYIIFRLSSFSRNLRNELKFNKKIYFYDNGIRNSVIANFSIAEMRTDIGALWENFLVSERKKKLEYSQKWSNSYFWRTTEQKEIDYIEESDGKIKAFEFKWNDKTKYKTPKKFIQAYTDAKFKIITQNNMEEFLL